MSGQGRRHSDPDPINGTASVSAEADVLGDPVHRWLADSAGLSIDRLGYAVAVEVRQSSKAQEAGPPLYRRRLYLTLAAAKRAVERATERGVAYRVQLVELRPAGIGEQVSL